MKPLWLVVLSLGVALAHPLPAQTVRAEGGSWGLLEPAALGTQLQTKDFLLINVHVPYEGEIAGTDRFIPFDQIATSKALPTDKKAEIVVYCRSGRMSRVAAQALAKLGYTNVRELKGGFNAWRAAGYTLEQKGR